MLSFVMEGSTCSVGHICGKVSSHSSFPRTRHRKNRFFRQVIFTEFAKIDAQNREQVNHFLEERWFSTDMVVRGTVVDLTGADGIAIMDHGRIIGLLTYILREKVLEITSLDSLAEGNGLGTALVCRALLIAKERGCTRVVAVTTNDNINAIRFYQKRGFDMARLYHGALDISRKLKPEIPLIGENGIPLKHEIEFEISLPR